MLVFYLFYPDIRSQRVGQQPTGNIERLPSSCTALPSCIHVRFVDTDRTKYTYKCLNFATYSCSGKQIYQHANTASHAHCSNVSTMLGECCENAGKIVAATYSRKV